MKRNRSEAIWLAACCLGLSPILSVAGDIKFTPFVMVSQRYSDNVNLSVTDPSASFITGINPGFRLRSKGGRASFDIDYNLDAMLYSNSTSGNTRNHLFSLNGKAELLEDRLMLILSARASQQTTSLTGASGGNTALSSALGGAGSSSYYTTNNKSNVRTYSAQPIWRSRFGKDANLEASWQVNLSQNEATGTGNETRSTANNLNLSLNSGNAFLHTPWSLRYNLNQSGSAGTTTRLASLSGSLGYQPSPKTRYSLTFGKDSNSAATTALSNSAGPYWNFGVNWSPSNRLSLEASAGHRRNSASYGLNATYRHRRFSLAMRYSETLQDTYSELTTTEAFDLYSCTGISAPVPVAAGSGSPGTGCTLVLAAALAQVPSITNLISLNKAWSGNASYNLGNSLFTLALSSSRRDLLGSSTLGESDQSTSISGAWSLRMGPRMGSILSLSKTHAESAGTESEDTTLAWSLTRKLSPDATGALDLRHMQRESGSTTGAYSENSISTRINMNF